MNSISKSQSTEAMIRSMLESHTDKASGTYHAGYSDIRIATDLNIPVFMVTNIRQQMFNAPTGIDDLRTIKANHEMLLRHVNEISRATQDLIRMYNAQGERIKSIESNRSKNA